MLRKTLFILMGGGVVALLACSSDSSDKYGDTGSFCAAKAEAECTQLAAQCGASVDACKSLRTSACTNSIPAGRSYTSSRAQDCLDKINSVYSQKTFTADQEKDVANVCGRVFAGNVNKNGACQVDFDCISDFVCDKGVCADKSPKNQGDPCANPGDVCSSDSYCANQGSNKFCLAKNPQDHTCDKDNPCLDTLRCVVGSGAANGSCKPKLAPSDPCTTDDECPAATTPPYCDPTKKKCLPKFGLGTKSCTDFGGPAS